MAAAVAVAPVPFKDEDDDSSDDDFADELEAQLFEAEVKRDAVTARVKRERDEGRDEEPSAKRVVRDAGRREEQHDGREGLATLPLELTLQILRWLSPEDLTSVGTTCKAMAFATADDSLWRRCFCSRFGHPKLTGVRSWRALYFQEDARELRLTTSSAPPDLRHLYAQMQAAKRAQPPETHDDALLTLTDAENVTRWRATRGLSDGSDPASRHTCSIAEDAPIADSARTYSCARERAARTCATTVAARGWSTWTECRRCAPSREDRSTGFLVRVRMAWRRGLWTAEQARWASPERGGGLAEPLRLGTALQASGRCTRLCGAATAARA